MYAGNAVMAGELFGLRGVSDRTMQSDWRKARLLRRRRFLGAA